MNEITDRIDKEININPIYYKDKNLKELLIVKKYGDLFYKTSNKSWKNFFKNKITLELSKNNKIKVKSNFKINSKLNFDFALVIDFSIKDTRHFPILNNLTDKLQSVVVITNLKEVYNYYTSRGINALLFNIPKVMYAKNNEFLNCNFDEINIMSKGFFVMKKIEEIMGTININMLLTIQDFFWFEQCATHSAKLFNIKTVTHQHGLIPQEVNGYKYIFSDKIMVWGKRSKKLLSKFVDEEKIIEIGTDKFNYLLNLKAENRNCITLAINPIPKEKNIKLIEEIFINLNKDNFKKYKFILKLHPAHELEEWQNILKEILKDNTVNFEITKESNDIVLNKTLFLLTYQSTMTLEAILAGSSVIELVPSFASELNEYFFEIPEFLVKPVHIEKEIYRRLNDSEYAKYIKEKQENIIKNEIEYFDSSNREADFLIDLIK